MDTREKDHNHYDICNGIAEPSRDLDLSSNDKPISLMPIVYE